MGYGKFALYYKSAVMLKADQQISNIQAASFPNFKKETRQKVMRDLKAAATQFLLKETKDYREVIKNLALKLRGGNG